MAAITAEAEKGYGFLVIGREPGSEGRQFHEQIATSVAAFSGPFAITIARGIDRQGTVGPRPNILVPVTGPRHPAVALGSPSPWRKPRAAR